MSCDECQKLKNKIDVMQKQMDEMIIQMNELNREGGEWKRLFLEVSSAWAVKKLEYEKVLNKSVS